MDLVYINVELSVIKKSTKIIIIIFILVSPWIHIQKCKVDLVKNVLSSNVVFNSHIDQNKLKSDKNTTTNAVVTLLN